MPEGDVTVDLSHVRKHKKFGNSKPSSIVYKERYKWWISKGFGPDSAKWSASWSLGLPRKPRIEEDSIEYNTINTAIQIGENRIYRVNHIVDTRKHLDGSVYTRAEAIEFLDDRLKMKQRESLITRGLASEDTLLFSIESNIFKEVSP